MPRLTHVSLLKHGQPALLGAVRAGACMGGGTAGWVLPSAIVEVQGQAAIFCGTFSLAIEHEESERAGSCYYTLAWCWVIASSCC